MSTQYIKTLGRKLLIAPGVELISFVSAPTSSSSGSTSGGSSSSSSSSGAPTTTLDLSNVALFGTGQSNAGYANDTDGALLEMAQGASAYLLATGTPTKISSAATDVSGADEYCGVSGFPSFLTYAGDTVAAAGAATMSSLGLGVLAAISALSPTQRSNIQAIVVYHGETASLLTAYAGNGGLGYGDKAVYEAAYLNYVGQIRAAIGKTAAQLPVIAFGPPYGTTAGACMVREAWAQMAANASNNVVFAVQQTYDSITRGNTSASGVETTVSPNGGHRDAADNISFYRRASLAVARAINASNGGASGNIPASLGLGLGPKIASASLSGTALTVTVAHDGGNDLVVPNLASQGVGWSVMDGGSIATPGALIQATACSRIDATHLAITLTSAPANAHTSCRLFYPYPGLYWQAECPGSPLGQGTEIGRGNAVTDNFGSITVATAFDLNQIIAAGWRMNMPIRPPIDGSFTFGLPLSS